LRVVFSKNKNNLQIIKIFLVKNFKIVKNNRMENFEKSIKNNTLSQFNLNLDENKAEDDVFLDAFGDSSRKVFLCLGSDKIVFDCLGPIVGTMLVNKKLPHYVYGTLARPITALQVEKAIEFIRKFHYGAEVIVIDSAIGKKEDIGIIKAFNHGLRPALGIDKQMRAVGDKSIMAIVTTKERAKKFNNSNVKLHDVYLLALKVCDFILESFNLR